MTMLLGSLQGASSCVLQSALHSPIHRDEDQSQSPDSVEVSLIASSYGNETFKWNNRACFGTPLHKACLAGSVHQVRGILDTGQGCAWDRFAYMTRDLAGNFQECTGTAVHLAASRDHLDVVELLLSARASVNCYVKRGRQDNYDVLQAAVFSEGRGGTDDMIDFLIHAGANICSTNANGLTCMHLAFQTGNTETIGAVQAHAAKSATLHFGAGEPSPNSNLKSKTPLELGIEMGKMNRQQLASVASPTSENLKSFIHFAPECIPLFLDRILDRDMVTPEDLADSLDRKDIACLLREAPEAALALLNGVTARPAVTSPGWHPLPNRVSFGPRSWKQRLWWPVFGKRRFIVNYESDFQWNYDDTTYIPPEWHSSLTDRKFGPPFFDADIKVCLIPNIISPDLFAALLSSAGDGMLHLYDNATLQAVISFTFWNGALWVDFAQSCITTWGLILLIFETWQMHEEAAATAISSRWRGYGDAVFTPSMLTSSDVKASVVADWILAKGLVDCFLELIQLIGCWYIDSVSIYFNLGNAWDIFRSILPVLLVWHSSNRVIHLLIVLIYWMRLLVEGITYAENVGHALLPIKQLATGLLPALSVTLVGFCAMTHAMYTVQEQPTQLWPDTFFQGFSTLITQGLPEHPPDDTLELLLMYAGVSFFSIFVLNIFIGVIGEQYSTEKQQVKLMFQNVRASCCLTFLLRALVLPCNLLTRDVSAILCLLGAIVAAATQFLALVMGIRLPGGTQLLVYVACQFLVFFCTIQCKHGDYPWEDSSHWKQRQSSFSYSRFSHKVLGRSPSATMCPKYLWICQAREMGKDLSPTRSDEDQLLSQSLAEQLRQIVREELEARGGEGSINGAPATRRKQGALPPDESRTPTLLGRQKAARVTDLTGLADLTSSHLISTYKVTQDSPNTI
eukprot:TRINITY_DN5537_c0_g5_i1.p1 TRINITY_DN5537_c0_g5~~TRINITY_DN5537_c0_g5_i1.p1  ORF type:complete len:910 (+),score=129.48 TRINITY_DN5537_c0_g5_i1:116-2845(+)